MKKSAVCFLTGLMAGSLLLTGCGSNPSAAGGSSAAQSASETEEEEPAEEEKESNHWYDLIDWSAYAESDANLLLGESQIEAPLTLDNMKPYITEYDIDGFNPNRVDLTLDEIPTSDATADFIKAEPMSDTITIDGIEYRMGFYDYTEQMPFKDIYAANQFGMYTDSGVMKSFGIIGLEKPDGMETNQYKIEALCEKYGMPSLVLLNSQIDNEFYTEMFWDRGDYLFGCLISDTTIFYENTYEFKIEMFEYYTKAAWDNYLANEEGLSTASFAEYIGIKK